MQKGQPPTLIDGKLPVFVFPTSLTFHSDDQTSHKLVLTLYNPYEFHLKFKVLCTVPRRFNVVDSEGSIKPHCCVDIVVRHKDVSLSNEGIRDKFRIQVYEYGQKTVIGKKDIPAILLPTKEGTQGPEETFEALPLSRASADTLQAQRSFTVKQGGYSSPSLVIVLAAVLCIVALMMPMHGDKESRLPDYLFLSQHQKLIAAYILGLVTMTILRS